MAYNASISDKIRKKSPDPSATRPNESGGLQRYDCALCVFCNDFDGPGLGAAETLGVASASRRVEATKRTFHTRGNELTAD
jgi:hypothetical protein